MHVSEITFVLLRFSAPDVPFSALKSQLYAYSVEGSLCLILILEKFGIHIIASQVLESPKLDSFQKLAQ